MPQQKHTQHASSTKTEYDYLDGWIKKVTYSKISPIMVNPRDLAGERRRRSFFEMKKKLKNTRALCPRIAREAQGAVS